MEMIELVLNKIKPCPFCGKYASIPELIYFSKSDKTCVFEIGCKCCGIYLNEASKKIDVESIVDCNKRLIEKWNNRVKGGDD